MDFLKAHDIPVYALERIRTELKNIESSPQRSATLDEAIRVAIDWTLGNNPRFEPRVWDQLVREEKSVVGSAVAREVVRYLGWTDKRLRDYRFKLDKDGKIDVVTNLPDAIVQDVVVEVKASCGLYYGCRQCQLGEVAIIFDICPYFGDYRVGVVGIDRTILGAAKNDAQKWQISPDAIKHAIKWVIHRNYTGIAYREPRLRCREAAAEQRAEERRTARRIKAIAQAVAA